jgi:hypothetical protein
VRGKAAAGKQSDRWHNSGGSKAARDLPAGDAKIRRRYGSIAQANGQKYRYHEYKLVFPTMTGPGDPIAYQSHKPQQNVVYQEDKSCVLYHVMLPLGEDPAEGDSDSDSSQAADAKVEDLLSSATRPEEPSIASTPHSENALSDGATSGLEEQNQPTEQQPAAQQRSGDTQTTPQWAQKRVTTQPEPLPESDKPKVDERPVGAAKTTTSTL